MLTISIHFSIPRMGCGTSAEVQPFLIKWMSYIAKKSQESIWTWWKKMSVSQV